MHLGLHYLTGITTGIILALSARSTKTVSWSGSLAGGIITSLLYVAFSWPGVLQLIVFFVLGTISSQIGYNKKHQSYISQSIRTWQNAVANAGIAAIFSVFLLINPTSKIYSAIIVASFAAAASDTISGEIGRVYGSNPRSILNFQKVNPGENGGITFEGTLVGIITSFFVAYLGYRTHLIFSKKMFILVGLAGVLGNLADSFLGATLENKGKINNEIVNFLATLFSALFVLVWNIFSN